MPLLKLTSCRLLGAAANDDGTFELVIDVPQSQAALAETWRAYHAANPEPEDDPGNSGDVIAGMVAEDLEARHTQPVMMDDCAHVEPPPHRETALDRARSMGMLR